MKKNLLKSMLFTAAAVLASVAAQAQCYIIGNDNVWQTNRAGAELQPAAEAGVYEGDVDFTSNYFFVATQLTAEAADWDGIRPNRYNPATADGQFVLYNTPASMAPATDEGVPDASFGVADTGTHKIRVDFNAKTVTVDGTYPEHIYMMGTDNAWQLGTPSATLNRVEGTATYRATVDIQATWFAFYTQMADSWETQGNYRWTAPNHAVPNEVQPNTEIRLVNDGTSYDAMYIGHASTYEVTFDYNRKTAYLYDPTYVPEQPECIYFIGNDNDWTPSTSFASIPKTAEDGVYRGKVKFGKGYFAIGTRLATGSTDWATFNTYRLCPADDGLYMNANSIADLYTYDETTYHTGAFQTEGGEFVVTVDLNANVMSFGDDLTAISGVHDGTRAVETMRYDAEGRRLTAPAKGINIIRMSDGTVRKVAVR